MKFSIYSIGGKHANEVLIPDKIPQGPGINNTKEKDTTSASFGHELRKGLFYPDESVGTNTCSKEEHPENKHKPLITNISTKEKSELNQMILPGPGSYSPQYAQASISYSMGNKTYAIDQPKNEKLGPGSYYSPKINDSHSSKAITFGKSSRFSYNSINIPGPGAYDITTSSKNDQGIHFSHSERALYKENGIPGPGYYEIPSISSNLTKPLTERSPSKMIETKKENTHFFIKSEKSPGPGAYSLNDLALSPSYSIGKSPRSNNSNTQNLPGPGQYCLSSRPEHKGKSFPKGKRVSINNSEIPGPGAYNINSNIFVEGPKFSKSERIIYPIKEGPPGPAYYNPNPNAINSAHASQKFGHSQRWNILSSQNNIVPGPGTYKVSEKKSSPMWSFKKGNAKTEIDDDEPGPGYYDIIPILPDIPKHTVLNRKSYKE